MYENMRKKDSEIESLKRELKHKNELIKSHEDHIKSINRSGASLSNPSSTQSVTSNSQSSQQAAQNNLKKRERSISRDGLDGYYMKMYKPQYENSTDGSGKNRDSEGDRFGDKSTSKQIESTTDDLNKIKYQLYEKTRDIESIRSEFRK